MNRTYIKTSILMLGMFILFAVILYGMGRIPICKCGYVKIWHGVTLSSENSQHISDWYTFSHIIHGFIFYFLLWLIARKLPVRTRLLLAILLEMSWEIFENTNFVINRYREVTISLDYYGDSIINSVSDVLAMIIGFIMARKMPISVILLTAIGMELFVGYYIKDNLTLNIIMLIYPFQTILKWQQGG